MTVQEDLLVYSLIVHGQEKFVIIIIVVFTLMKIHAIMLQNVYGIVNIVKIDQYACIKTDVTI